MANNDSAVYVLRYNEISAAIEALNGLNWKPIVPSLNTATITNLTSTNINVHRLFEQNAGQGISLNGDGAISVLADRGLVLTNLTTTERDAIATPAEGTVIANTTTHTMNYYDGTVWQEVATV